MSILLLLSIAISFGIVIGLIIFVQSRKKAAIKTTQVLQTLSKLNEYCVYNTDCVDKYKCHFDTCQIPFYDTKIIQGWTVHVNPVLKSEPNYQQVMSSFEKRLNAMVLVLPNGALNLLRKIPIYWNPQELYPNYTPGAVWHPNKQWMRDNNRDPAIAPGIEMTNMKIWDFEMIRQPWVILHELAHGYHEQVLGGNTNQVINDMFERAKSSGKYDNVERRDEYNQKHCCSRHYALTNPFEFFAEMSEAYFGLNDMYPYIRSDLYEYDKDTHDTIKMLWGA